MLGNAGINFIDKLYNKLVYSVKIYLSVSISYSNLLILFFPGGIILFDLLTVVALYTSNHYIYFIKPAR